MKIDSSEESDTRTSRLYSDKELLLRAKRLISSIRRMVNDCLDLRSGDSDDQMEFNLKRQVPLNERCKSVIVNNGRSYSLMCLMKKQKLLSPIGFSCLPPSTIEQQFGIESYPKT